MEDKKRKPGKKERMQRSKNFSDVEKLSLIKVIARYPDLENKETDKLTQQDKDVMWDDITEEYNRYYAQRYGERRNDSLRNCWGNLKQKARTYRSGEKAETFVTGGGQKNFIKDAVMEEVLKVVGHQLAPLPCVYDDDAPDRPEVPWPQQESSENNDPMSLSIFEYLKKSGVITDWAKWNSKKLKKEIAAPLKENRDNVRKSVVQLRHSQPKKQRISINIDDNESHSSQSPPNEIRATMKTEDGDRPSSDDCNKENVSHQSKVDVDDCDSSLIVLSDTPDEEADDFCPATEKVKEDIELQSQSRSTDVKEGVHTQPAGISKKEEKQIYEEANEIKVKVDQIENLEKFNDLKTEMDQSVIFEHEKKKLEIELLRANLKKAELEVDHLHLKKEFLQVNLEMKYTQLSNLQRRNEDCESMSSEGES